jgi:hypothetical protein
MDKLGGLFAERMDAQEPHVATAEMSFKKPFAPPTILPRAVASYEPRPTT